MSYRLLINLKLKDMLFGITNKKTSEMQSTKLTAFMVHYLFIVKKWDKYNCLIHDAVGHKMSYERFNERYPLTPTVI